MSSDIFVQVVRNGVQIYPKIYVQKDNMDNQEAAYYGGVGPYHRYWGFPQGIYTILQQDLLIDLYNIDPKTNALAQYRVINDPEPFPDFHMELVMDRMVGT